MSWTPQNGEQDLFLAAIVADPQCDEPRLAFAKWLDEQGDPRGGFIRAQCDYAHRYALDPADPECGKAYRRQGELFETHKAEWLPPVWDRYGIPLNWVQFERGFATTVSIREPDRVLGNLDELLDLFPLVRTLQFNELTSQQIRQLIESPAIVRIAELSLGGSAVGQRGAQAIARSEQLRSLNTLRMNDCNLGDFGLEVLCNSAALPNLKEWAINDNGLTDSGLQTLADSPNSQLLEVIHVGHRDIRPRQHDSFTNHGVEALLNSSTLDRLRTVHWSEGMSAQVEDCGTKEEFYDVPGDRRVRLLRHIESIW